MSTAGQWDCTVPGDGPSRREPWPPAWVDSIHTGETDLGVRARDILRAEFGKQ